MNLLLAVAFLLASLLPALSYSAEPTENRQLSSINVGKLRQAISAHEEKIEQSSLEEHSLLDEIDSLDDTISQQKRKIDALQTQILEQERVIDAKEKELTAIYQKNETLRQHLIKRLRSFYFMGKTGFLNIIFSSETLPDLMMNNDAFRSLVTYDQALFAEYRKSVTEIDRAKRTHELEKSVKEHFLADADKENALLQQTAKEKNEVLKRVQTQKGLYEQALKEMKKSENNLTTALTQIDRTAKPSEKSHGFLASKGRLPPPTRGEVIRRFHESSASDEDTTFTNGITIKTPENSEVYAVSDGTVIFAGYMRGYGKMVIIDHEQQYYTVTARFDEIRVEEGDLVKEGQLIGKTGEIATLFGKGLYFEIRHEAIAENPLNWLRPGLR